MKRQNVAPGALALNYLLSFNNELHTSQTEAAQMVLWGNHSGGRCGAVPGPLVLQPLGTEDGSGKEREKPLFNGLLCSMQVWELRLKLFIDCPGAGGDSGTGDDAALSPLLWPCCSHG